MPLLTITLRNPVGAPVTRAVAEVRLLAGPGLEQVAGFRDGVEIVGRQVAEASAGGLTFALYGNEEIVPSGTVYGVELTVNGVRQRMLHVLMPADGGPYDLFDVLTDPPGAVASSALVAALAAHAATPHGGLGSYLHDQQVPLSSWTINHPLPFYPNVTIVDTLNRYVIGDVSYPSATQVVVAFSAAFSGKCFLS